MAKRHRIVDGRNIDSAEIAELFASYQLAWNRSHPFGDSRRENLVYPDSEAQHQDLLSRFDRRFVSHR